jgi:hypothetical protein
MTRERVLQYLDAVESRRAVSRLDGALAGDGLVPVQEAVAGGGGAGGLQTRVRTSSSWDDDKAAKVIDLYTKAIDHDLTISVVSAYSFLALILVLGALLVLIVYQVVGGRFSAKQLAGIPLVGFFGFVFRAYRNERQSQAKLRKDVMRARELFTVKTSRAAK